MILLVNMHVTFLGCLSIASSSPDVRVMYVGFRERCKSSFEGKLVQKPSNIHRSVFDFFIRCFCDRFFVVIGS